MDPVAGSTRPSLLVPSIAIQIDPSPAGTMPYGTEFGVGAV
jgi:hypothetical protein